MIQMIQTERGLINIEAEYQSKEHAIMDGYSFYFHSTALDKDIYKKCMDMEGKNYSFAIIIGYY